MFRKVFIQAGITNEVLFHVDKQCVDAFQLTDLLLLLLILIEAQK